MDKIHGILERHERWLEKYEPCDDNGLTEQQNVELWEAILRHIRENLELHELMANIKSMGFYSKEEDERVAKKVYNG